MIFHGTPVSRILLVVLMNCMLCFAEIYELNKDSLDTVSHCRPFVSPFFPSSNSFTFLPPPFLMQYLKELLDMSDISSTVGFIVSRLRLIVCRYIHH